jgi:acetyl esterase/lipase
MKPARKKLFSFISVSAAVASLLGLSSCRYEDEPAWPRQVKEIRYLSSADSTLQPALFHAPQTTEKAVPLLVGLHTWSGSYTQKMSVPYAEWCVKNGWIFIHPDFRGPNKKPEATGSELVVKDILSAVDYAKNNANVDSNRIYLVGVSGGGYTALLMAARAPDIWAGVSAWVPISDLKAWYYECRAVECDHADDIVKSCGGVPGVNQAVDFQYKKRSPITYLNEKVDIPLDINAGITDGHHSGGVPVSHSLIAFNLVAAGEDRISEEDIQFFAKKAEVPPHLKRPLSDATYGKKVPLFRRGSGKAWVTIFDGGHEIIYEAALTWLAKQQKKKGIVAK